MVALWVYVVFQSFTLPRHSLPSSQWSLRSNRQDAALALKYRKPYEVGRRVWEDATQIDVRGGRSPHSVL